MKRSMTLALLVLAAIVCVVATGCGSRKDQSTNDTMNGTTSSSGATSSNGSANGSNGSGDSASGSGGAIGSTMEGVGDAITGSNGSGSGSGSGSGNGSGSSSGSGSTSNHYASSGVPYDQMLDNGKVTDHDGNLNNDHAARGR